MQPIRMGSKTMTKTNMPPDRLIELDNVHVHFPLREGLVKAVNGVSYHVNKGEVLGIVGESGSGKSITARAIMRLLPKRAVSPEATPWPPSTATAAPSARYAAATSA